MELAAFALLAAVALGSALLVVFGRNAVVCSLALAGNLVAIAGLFLSLHAQFIGFLQIIVYAGAIMVLIVFVLMLLNVQEEARLRSQGLFQRWLGLGLVVALAAMLGLVTAGAGGSRFGEPSPTLGTVSSVGQALFTRFFYPFEAISLLLVVAMVGAVLLAKKRL